MSKSTVDSLKQDMKCQDMIQESTSHVVESKRYLVVKTRVQFQDEIPRADDYKTRHERQETRQETRQVCETRGRVLKFPKFVFVAHNGLPSL